MQTGLAAARQAYSQLQLMSPAGACLQSLLYLYLLGWLAVLCCMDAMQMPQAHVQLCSL
jgi:hypothetical protein